MADPLSISAAIVGIAVPALHGARLLLDDLGKIINAPEAVQRLAEEANSISANLDMLKDIEGPVWASLGTAVCDQSKKAIGSCETACGTIREDIQHWTRRSKGGKLSWLDRVNVGVFREQQLKAHSDRLRAYSLSISSTVGTATLYSSIRNSQMTEEIRNAVTLHRERIASASSTARTEVAVVQRTLSETQSRSGTDPATDDVDEYYEDEMDSTVTNLEDLMQALKLCQTMLQELSSRLDSAKVANASKDSGATNITFGKNEQGMQMVTNYGSVTWNSNK